VICHDMSRLLVNLTMVPAPADLQAPGLPTLELRCLAPALALLWLARPGATLPGPPPTKSLRPGMTSERTWSPSTQSLPAQPSDYRLAACGNSAWCGTQPCPNMIGQDPYQWLLRLRQDAPALTLGGVGRTGVARASIFTNG
jgi:hypothetical protein